MMASLSILDRARALLERSKTEAGLRFEQAKSAYTAEACWQEGMRTLDAYKELPPHTTPIAGLLIRLADGACLPLQEGINESGTSLIRLEMGELRLIPKQGEPTCHYTNDVLALPEGIFQIKLFPTGRHSLWIRFHAEVTT